MFAGIISSVILKLTEWFLTIGYHSIAKIIDYWIDQKRQDEIDQRVKREAKNPDRSTSARDLNRSFD